MQTEKTYSKVEEAKEIVIKLCEKYPDVFWTVDPNIVEVLGIDNKARINGNTTLAKIIPVRGAEKAVMKMFCVPIRYIIEVYWADWNVWDVPMRQWIIAHELEHIPIKVGETMQHDCKDFNIIIDKVGINWTSSKDLPNLLTEDVKFNLDLRPSIEGV